MNMIPKRVFLKNYLNRGLTRCSIVAHPKANLNKPWTPAVMHRIDSTELILVAAMAMGFGTSMTTIMTTGTTTMPTRAGTG